MMEEIYILLISKIANLIFHFSLKKSICSGARDITIKIWDIETLLDEKACMIIYLLIIYKVRHNDDLYFLSKSGKNYNSGKPPGIRM
jgi:hypothetical protein